MIAAHLTVERVETLAYEISVWPDLGCYRSLQGLIAHLNGLGYSVANTGATVILSLIDSEDRARTDALRMAGRDAA